MRTDDAGIRRAARALVLAPSGRILLIHGRDPAEPERRFWFTPGGGLDPGESLDDAVRRELREETGHVIGQLGPPVMERLDEFSLAGESYRQHEWIFLVLVDEEFEPAPQGFDTVEAEVITEMAWLSPEEMRALPDPYYPKGLAPLAALVATGEIPDPPWRQGLDDR